MPTRAIHGAVRTNVIPDLTARKAVRYLAEHEQHPAFPKHLKSGWEAADRYFLGYMPSKCFTKICVPDSEINMMRKVARAGHLSPTSQEMVRLFNGEALAEKEGPLRDGKLFRGCDLCTRLKFDACQMVESVGKKIRRVSAPLTRGTSTHTPQLVALEEWAGELRHGMLVAMVANVDEQGLECVTSWPSSW